MKMNGPVKMFALMAMLLGLSLLAGCGGTPGMTAEERYATINRNFQIDWDQTTDDIDHMLLLRPCGTLSGWNIYHRD